MNEKITIEKMTAKDVNKVYSMNLEIFLDDPWKIEWFFEGVNDPDGFYFLAYYNNELVGYCGMYLINERTPSYCKIATLAVLPRFQFKGIGKRLLMKMLDTAKEHGITRVKLEVNTGNDAIKLYESFGFRIEELKKNYFEKSGGDAYIMWRYE